MGLFFTGGIERYLYYIDKYGNHDKYEYYILYINNNSKYYYDIKNIKMISYDWDHNKLNQYLHLILPHLIIDHYSIYLPDNNIIYEGINRNNIIYFVHSAICYKNNIDNLYMKKAIHLYKEDDKEQSWYNIKINYYITLGIENPIYSYNINQINNTNNTSNNIPNNISNKKLKNNQKTISKIKINIIGRITEEKIPLLFLEKLCKLSKQMKNIEFNIYGEKDIKFSKVYVDKFNDLIKQSNIKVHDFVNPDNIYEIYENTHVLLIPSIYETGSFTCLEAYSYGIPVIARNVYGLKYLIHNNITGYLCNNDEEILDKIKIINNKKTDNLLTLENKKNIFEIAKKYNIHDKIKDLENIIDNNLVKSNLFIITSVLNCSKESLSYYNVRSIFDINERYKQTLKTLSSIRQKVHNVKILFCECSDLKNYQEEENELKNKVDYYYNFYQNENIRTKVNSKYKGLGEAHILLESLKIIQNEIIDNYENIFKLSGRYYLNSNFNYDYFNNNYDQFTNWDSNIYSYCTLIYKIKYNSLQEFENCLKISLNELESGNSIEQCMYNNFSNVNVKVIDKFNVSGFLATEGYLFSI